MEQILIRNLPDGTKAALKAKATHHGRSVEAEARAILAEAVGPDTRTIVDLLAADDGADIEFEPVRLGISGRPVDF